MKRQNQIPSRHERRRTTRRMVTCALLCALAVVKSDVNGATKRAIVESYDYVLGLDLLKEEAKEENGADAELEAFVLAKIEERAAAKKEKDFAKADAIRAELLEKGVEIKDTREGVVWSLI